MRAALIAAALVALCAASAFAATPASLAHAEVDHVLPPNMTKYFVANVTVSYSSAKTHFVLPGMIYYDVTLNKRLYQWGTSETGVTEELFIYHALYFGHNYTIVAAPNGTETCETHLDFILKDVNMFYWLGLGLYNGTLDVDGTKCQDWVSGDDITPLYDVCIKPNTNIPVRYAIFTYAPMEPSSTIFTFNSYDPIHPNPAVFNVPSVCSK